MKLREYINETSVYKQVENEIRTWVESRYPGLSIEFEPRLEVVQVDSRRRFTAERVRRIVEAVNIMIGDIMEAHAEEIYIAERLERIYKNHPSFDIDVCSVEDIKKNRQFLKYLDELVVREQTNGQLQ